MSHRTRSAIPGFRLSIAWTLLYLLLIVLIPLSTIGMKTVSIGWDSFWRAALTERAVASYELSFGASLVASVVNAAFGFLVAWVLVRYSFPGRRLIDALVDLPFALPTAVAGIALTTIYAKSGWIGGILARGGIEGAFSRFGIVVALTFVGLPFVVRTVQPVLQELGSDVEEAAATLGADRWQTFRRVILPQLAPAILTGAALAFARGVGEYGSVVFIAGNMPMRTEITPLLIVTKLEQFDDTGANALATVMLVISFAMLLAINGLQWWSRRMQGSVAQ
ncbi:MAG TPA: sulfate ABC transporter permease subunit CysT [Thermoanaerobaculia bacterium]|nr:sulfate ABC transporter permease subunit CysT [Thermoanaerobaculia bacterium]